MPFTDRFQLLDLKRDEGARTFEAREIATGRPVYVHLFADCTAPLNRALLAKLDTLPEEERTRILDRGEHEGGIYLVTDRLAEYPGLREWLKAKNEERPKSLDARGAWQFKPPAPLVEEQPVSPFDTAPLPAIEPSIISPPPVSVLGNSGEQTLQMQVPVEAPPPVVEETAPPPPAPPTPAPNEPGEFTRQFARPVLRPTPPAPKEPAPPTPPANEPGEFTRQFAPPVLRPAPSAPKETPPPAASPVDPSAPPANEAGEFTRQFAPPVLRPTPPAPKETAPPANEPGEFTRQFAPPVLRPTPTPPPPAGQTPGEFTQMFAANQPKPTTTPKAAPPPGEFTRQFQSPQRPPSPRVPTPPQNAVPAPPPAGKPGEFTQMLQAQRPSAPAAPVKQPSQTAEFSSYFESPMTPQGPTPHNAPLTPPRPPSHPKDAGEFTQIFGRGDIPSPPPPPAPAAPPNPSSANATQVFATPRPLGNMPMAAPNSIPEPRSQGPGEYTQMFAKPASLTFGQPPAGPAASRFPEPARQKRNTSRLPLLLVIGAAVLLIIAVVVYIMLRPHAT